VLIEALPGLGAELLAAWMSALVLCEDAEHAPCSQCRGCRLLAAGSHPDQLVVRREDDAQQLKIDQVRSLIEAFTQTSFRGGYKVAILEGAERLNESGANALLKTLEEPTDHTLLIVIANPLNRLPATIKSRCQRLVIKAPPDGAATAWLVSRAPENAKTPAVLRTALKLAANAPLLALELLSANLVELTRDMQASLKELAANHIDVTLLAERWTRADLTLRLRWLEEWAWSQIRGRLTLSNVDKKSKSKNPLMLGALYSLLDDSRALRALGGTGVNQQLGLEAMLARNALAFRP
jgi:DNA polymerase-3 subunit delta'